MKKAERILYPFGLLTLYINERRIKNMDPLIELTLLLICLVLHFFVVYLLIKEIYDTYESLKK